MERVVNQAMRADSGYKKQVWGHAARRVQQVVGRRFVVTEKQCRSKHDYLKADWKAWEALVNQSGFGVDSSGCVTAPEHVLTAYVNAHPEARKFLKSPLQFEELHRQLFEGVMATGSGALTVDDMIYSVERSPSASLDSDPEHRTARRYHRRKLKEARQDKISEGLQEIAAYLGKLDVQPSVDVQERAISVFMEAYAGLDFSLQNVVVDAFEREYDAKRFLSLPVQARNQWIIMKLRKAEEEGGLFGVDVESAINIVRSIT